MYDRCFRVGALLTALMALAPGRCAAAQDGTIIPTSALTLRGVSAGGRTALHRDAVEARIAAGEWRAPKAGETLTGPNGAARVWTSASFSKDGGLPGAGFTGGYAYTEVASSAERVMLLEASGHSMVYVNGAPRAGDPYGNGIVRLPVLLHPGANGFLFLNGRGDLHMRLIPVDAPALIDTRDTTICDIILGEKARGLGAVVVQNASTEWSRSLTLDAQSPGGGSVRTALPAIPPLGVRKVAFRFTIPMPRQAGDVQLDLRLTSRGRTLSAAQVRVRVRRPVDTHMRTFVSGIDDSVQYFAVNPAAARPGDPRPGLVLTTHGAGVQGLGQAEAYSAKRSLHIVAPTNRRPFGFDWEDWGRLDALEVLEAARGELQPDPARVYVAGHSMGGHGSWILGALYPGLFAASAPSAGWRSFASYGGGSRPGAPGTVDEILGRPSVAGDPVAVLRNYEDRAVYVLHGDADDNVPVDEARGMVAELKGLRRCEWLYHEQPGAGHWWDDSDEAGAGCLDWAPIFDLFNRRRLPAAQDVRDVEFATPNPEITSRRAWLTVVALEKAFTPGWARLRCDPYQRRFTGTTSGIARMTLDLAACMPGKQVKAVIDGQNLGNIETDDGPTVTLERADGKWRVATSAYVGKSPLRSGPFKHALNHGFTLVVGTRGSAAENAWALAKARYDSETFWYRGNGSPSVVLDSAVDLKKKGDVDRSYILYGNSRTNGLWAALLAGSPVDASPGTLRVGGRSWTGDNLACVFLRPRPGSQTACVGVVGGTGLPGMRLTERLPYFLSGAGFPDVLALGPETLTAGSAGVRAAGFFGNDWGVESGEWVFGPEKP